MITPRRLITAQALLCALLGFGTIFHSAPLPAGWPEARPWECAASLRLLGMGMGGMGLALWFLGLPAGAGERRRLFLGLAVANAFSTIMVLGQQIAIWGTSWGLLLILSYLALTAGCAWWAREAGPAGAGNAEADPGGFRPPGRGPRWLGASAEELRRTSAAAALEERKRLARDLHDSIKQQLFAIQVGAATAHERLESDPEGARSALSDVRRSAHEAMVEMRAMIEELSPQAVATAGLVSALRDQCEAAGYRSGAQVEMALGEVPPNERLPGEAQQVLLRTAQEALSNIVRHACARQVRVSLGACDARMVLSVSDDGRGFDAETGANGMGLRNVRERAAAVGGTARVASVPGEGTTVEVAVPLAPPELAPLERTMLQSALQQAWWAALVTAALVLGAWGAADGVTVGSGRSRGSQLAQALTAAALALAFLLWTRARARTAAAAGASAAAISRLRQVGRSGRVFLWLLAAWFALPYRWNMPVRPGDQVVGLALALACSVLYLAEIGALWRRVPGPPLRQARARAAGGPTVAVGARVVTTLIGIPTAFVACDLLVEILLGGSAWRWGLAVLCGATGAYIIWRQRGAVLPPTVAPR